jgi:hypothetical protein
VLICYTNTSCATTMALLRATAYLGVFVTREHVRHNKSIVMQAPAKLLEGSWWSNCHNDSSTSLVDEK